jgi:hypothetical protein
MQESTLPLWAMIQVINLILAIVGGLCAPYVSKTDSKLARKFINGINKESPPTIKIRSRRYYGYVVWALIVLNLISLIFFMSKSFLPFTRWIGYGLFGVVSALLCTLLVYIVVGSMIILIATSFASMRSFSLQRKYERQGLKVEVIEYDQF